jgi:hypothetical protein
MTIFNDKENDKIIIWKWRKQRNNKYVIMKIMNDDKTKW